MYRNRNITSDITIIKAIKKMDSLGCKLLIVEENDFFIGLVSAGDIQRAIIRDISLNEKVKSILRSDVKVAHPGDSFEMIKRMMLDFRMEFCPLVTSDQKVLDIYFWEDLFLDQKPQIARKFDLPVVIMAGGKGSRLKPLTHVLPKPLIPINEKTIIEEILQVFADHGCNNFFISLNYKADLIKYYLSNRDLPFIINYVEECNPMGTAGSLGFLNDKIHQTLFVTNCDILIKQDYSEILDYHYDQGNELTIVAALKHIPIMYGTIETGKNGQLVKITEKPELTFKINSGMYILEPHLLKEIQVDRATDFTDLIGSLAEQNRKIGVFPVSESSWVDVGDWNLYLSALGTKKISSF